MSRLETPTATQTDTPVMGAARMAGSQGTPPTVPPSQFGSTPTGDPQQALANAVNVIREAEQSIVDLSRQFPEASEEVRQVRASLRKLLTKIVANPGGSEPIAPRTGM